MNSSGSSTDRSSLASQHDDGFDPFASLDVNLDIERVAPSTEAQREVWLASQLSDEASLAFNEAVKLQFRGDLRIDALTAALHLLVARHESLRATFSEDGLQFVVGSAIGFEPKVLNFQALEPSARDSSLRNVANDLVSQVFDLARGPLLRATVVSLTAHEHVLLLCAHHIVCDGWSFGVLVSDLAQLYSSQVRKPAGEPALLPPGPVRDQYSDYCILEAEQRTSVEYLQDERWWVAQFDTPVLALDLPLDRPRPLRRRFESARIDVRAPAGLMPKLKQFALTQDSSLFGVLFSGFAALLQRLTGQTELVVGVPAAGQASAEMPGLIGHCVNFLPIRLSLDANAKVFEQVSQTQSRLLDAFDHQRFTFGTLLKALQLPRDAARLPLVSVMFNLDQRIDSAAIRFEDIETELSSLPRAYENFELFLNVTPHGDGLIFEAQYNRGLFDETSIAAWLASYSAILQSLVAADSSTLVDALNVFDAQQTAALAQWNNEATQIVAMRSRVGSDELGALLRASAIQFANAPAVVAGRARLTHAELGTRVTQLSHLLRARGAGPDVLVGICLPRSADMLVAVLAVLEAGAAFVPLDPTFPADRLAFMIEDADLSIMVSDAALIQSLRWPDAQARATILVDRDAALISQQAAAPLAYTVKDSLPAYVLYTSGSSGRPKGVVVPRRALANLLRSVAVQPGLQAGDRLLAVTTLSFDISLLELLLPIVCGATVVIATREQVLDPLSLAELIKRHEVNVLQATPAGWRLLLESGWHGGDHFKALVGGEALPQDLARQLLERCGQCWNMYGPTETTIWSTCWKVSDSPSMAIGRPIANTQVYVLGDRGALAPIGARGEICIAGEGLALGYLKRDELTAEKFVNARFLDGRVDGWADGWADGWVSGAGQSAPLRVYRTGDLGRWRADGQLEHLGRLDAQVKLRGYRIELGEIEAALQTKPGVAEAVVVIRGDQDPKLMAYVVAAAGERLDPEGLRAQLKSQLPDYMIPQYVLELPELPRLPNTKIDRSALPLPDAPSAAMAVNSALLTSSQVAANELETGIALQMGKVLGLVDIGLDQDFFALGGHSLSAAQLLARINQEFSKTRGVTVPLRAIFEAPTVRKLAQWVTQAEFDRQNVPAAIAARSDRARAPLSLVQQRLWFLEQLHPGRSLYNTPSAHRLRGPLNLAHLQAAFEAVVQRQEVLRTYVALEADSPVQRIAATVSFDLTQTEDLSGLAPPQQDSELRRRLDALIEAPINLRQAPLFVVRVFKLSAHEHVLFFMPHHFIWDGWSFDLFYDEISAAYVAQLEGKPLELAPPAIAYGDFCVWQREWLKGPEFAQQLAYWRGKLAVHDQVQALQTDYPRRASMSGRGSTEWVSIDRALVASLRQVASAGQTTLAVVLLSAFSLLLTSLGSRGVQSIGVPVRGRSRTETEPLMGYFTNLLPLMLNPSAEQTFPALLGHVKSELFGAYSSPDVPIEHLMSSLTGSAQGSGAANSRPLYLALFSFQDARARPLDWGNLRHERYEVAQKGATEDFGLWLVESDAGLVGGLTYNTDLYRPDTARALHRTFMEILQRVVASPSAQLTEITPMPTAAANTTLSAANAPHGLEMASSRVPKTMPGAAAAVQALESESQRVLAGFWQTLLKIESIEPQDNFFDLGGNSLLAMQALSMAEAHFKTKVDARRYVFESLAQLAIAYEQSAPKTDEKPGLLGRLFGRKRA